MSWAHILGIFDKRPDVSHVAMCVLFVLAKAADQNGECHPSAEYIADITKLSLRSVRNGLSELKHLGYLKWKSGRHSRSVNKYQISDEFLDIHKQISTINQQKDVDNSKHVHHVHSTRAPRAQYTCTTCTSDVHQVHFKRAPGAHKDIKEDTKEVSKLVMHPNEAPTEELLVKQGNKTQSRPPKAASIEYVQLFKTEGWKPKDKTDVSAIVDYCYKLGVSIEESKSFARYNNLRKWRAVDGLATVHQLAVEWFRKWKKESYCEYEAEVTRRSEAKRREEIRELERRTGIK